MNVFSARRFLTISEPKWQNLTPLSYNKYFCYHFLSQKNYSNGKKKRPYTIYDIEKTFFCNSNAREREP